MLTLIVPVRGAETPKLTTTPAPDGGLRAETTVGGRRLAFEITRGGDVRRPP